MTVNNVGMDIVYLGLYALGSWFVLLSGIFLLGAVVEGIVTALQILRR